MCLLPQLLFCEYMNIAQAILLSFVEGLSEFLPISSTGHLILASKLLGVAQTDFVKSFEISIQLGAILAVGVLYGRKILVSPRVWLPILVAFLPSAVLGFIFYGFIKNVLVGDGGVVLVSLFLGGLILVFVEKILSRRVKECVREVGDVGVGQAFLIGVAQSISMVPGVSRAAATIVGGMFVGLTRQAAVEFSFLLAIPTVVGAVGLDLAKFAFSFSQAEFVILGIGFVGSFVTALFAVGFLVDWVKNHTLFAFGVYRVVLAILFWGLVW